MHHVRRVMHGAAAAALAVGLLAAAAPAQAADSATTSTTSSASGADGQQLAVNPTTNLSPDGQALKVTGTGFDDFKGIYVALCLVPAPGKQPTPCGGGIDMSGESQTSAWISSNPPSYGKSLAQPYGNDGSFEVSVWAGATLPDGQDCRQVACALVSRADHLRTSDRSQDVIVPVTFAAEAPATNESDANPAVLVGAGLGVLVLLGAIPLGVTVTNRRRRALPSDPQRAPAVSEAP